MSGKSNLGKSAKRVAYIMSRFPKLTETFIFNEILAMEGLGFDVEIFPLKREQATVVHPEVEALVRRAHFSKLLSLTVLLANLGWLLRRPLTYFKTWWVCLAATFGSRRYFLGAIATVPLAARFARQMQRAQIDHVHAHFVSHPAVAALVIHRLTGIPFSFTAHGSDLHREHRMLKEKVGESQFAVTISEFNREWIVDKCGEETRAKTHVIHCGVRPSEFPDSELRETPDPLRLLCIGSLHEVKGQSYLLEASELLLKRGVRHEVHLVGDGPDRDSLTREASERGLEQTVIFHGPQPRGEVLSQLCSADIVLTPSVASQDGRREGIPVVLMEAMAAGKPVVASRLSGIPELVEDQVSGVLVPPRDAPAIASAVERLASRLALRTELADRAKAKIELEFNLDREAEKLARLIDPSFVAATSERHSQLQEAV